MIGKFFAAAAACGSALVLYCCVVAGKRADEQAEYWKSKEKTGEEDGHSREEAR